jgi:hypothetical protein
MLILLLDEWLPYRGIFEYRGKSNRPRRRFTLYIQRVQITGGQGGLLISLIKFKRRQDF